MNSVHDADADADAATALPERLARLDLNLLVAFDALARERNVTRAAERVGITQSAMSHALKRLRGWLGDPLLVRGEGGMVLTARAEDLVVPLRSGLVSLDRAIHRAPRFDARTAQRAFRLVTPDLFDLLAIPALLERLRRDAPGVDLAILAPEGQQVTRALTTGELDAAIAARVEGFDAGADASGLVRRVMFHDGFSCFCRADHPALGARGGRRRRSDEHDERALSLESYAAASHALVSPRGDGPGFVDELLAHHGLRRRVALRVPSFFCGLAIIERSDLILTAPSSLARLIAPGSRVACVAAPLALPQHAVQMVWHERFTNDPGHVFLRELLLGVGAELGTAARAGARPAARTTRSKKARA
jgi:DNA-binding transcriptional LysR family regulator